MKALTLWQPWATLIAIGAKRVETRSWATAYRGPLAIHAAVRPVRADEIEREMVEALRWCWPPTTAQLRSLPLGSIVATCRLVDIYRVSRSDADAIEDGETIRLCSARIYATDIDRREAAFGNYGPGRCAWVLADVQAIEPVSVPGARGLWEWGR
jgi:activating signal cointegrator 1